MTRSKGSAEEVSLPPTRMRKDVSTMNGEKDKAQGQVQANVQSRQRSTDTPSPFARPGSWAGTSTTPASEVGMQPASSNLFAWPDSRAGFAPPKSTSSHSSSLSPMSGPLFQEDVNTSVSWDLVDTDADMEVASINSPSTHQTVTNKNCADSSNESQNNTVGLNHQLKTLGNQDFFVADTTGRRLSQIVDKSSYPSLLPNGNAALQLRLPDLLIYLKTDTYLIDVKTIIALERCPSCRSYMQHGHTGNCFRQSTMMLCVLVLIHQNRLQADRLHQLFSIYHPLKMLIRLSENNSHHHASLQFSSMNCRVSAYKCKTDVHKSREESSSAKSCGSSQCYLQQSRYIGGSDTAGTSQCCPLQGSAAHPEEPTHTSRHQTSAYA